jgi:Mg2+-importing ATPase
VPQIDQVSMTVNNTREVQYLTMGITTAPPVVATLRQRDWAALNPRAKLRTPTTVEEVLACCTRVREPGPNGGGGPADGAPALADAPSALKDTPITAADQARLRATAERLNAEGLRVVAVAVRPVPVQPAYHVADEAGLTLVGYVAFLDPPKESTAPALAALARHGVAVKVLTGDNEAVTRKVCANVGLAVSGVLLGPELAALDDAALRTAVESHNVYAKLAPQDKERIVNALRANGHVVGFMGDGINDAPALHAADVAGFAQRRAASEARGMLRGRFGADRMA